MSISSPDSDTVGPADPSEAVARVLDWYAGHARDLPWRSADRTPWGVLVSEIMLQQTQVSRVEARWREWMQRWPSPAALAAAPLAQVLQAWQGMGYPRRVLRLHEAAGTIVAKHRGLVPSSVADLRALPGVGEYTAAAVAAFAFGEPIAVLDTNVRRVYGRWHSGLAFPATAGISSAERELASAMLPGDRLAALWSVAVMELGALVCRARTAQCEVCPLRSDCAWVAAGRPPGNPPTRQPKFAGSDRQARGYVLRLVTEYGPTPGADLIRAWSDHLAGTAGASDQARRAIGSLVADGLLETSEVDVLRLPGS